MLLGIVEKYYHRAPPQNQSNTGDKKLCKLEMKKDQINPGESEKSEEKKNKGNRG